MPNHQRPLDRWECQISGLRPCPFISCKYHLLWDITDLYKLGRHAFRRLSDDQIIDLIQRMECTCMLDVTDLYAEGVSEKVLGRLLHMTRQRVNQLLTIESGQRQSLIRKLRHPQKAKYLREFKMDSYGSAANNCTVW